jgi:hypothetical protein
MKVLIVVKKKTDESFDLGVKEKKWRKERTSQQGNKIAELVSSD